jgi:hypothetical protein
MIARNIRDDFSFPALSAQLKENHDETREKKSPDDCSGDDVGATGFEPATT